MAVTISVAMATFNGGAFLAEQLLSIAQQSCLPLELVVRDDCSTDDTLAILHAWAATAPFPVTILPPGPRLGYADNFFAAIDACKGDYVAFCDQDDVWLPQKLQTITAVISQADRPAVVMHSAQEVDGELRPLGVQGSLYRPSRSRRLKADPTLVVRGLLMTARRDVFSVMPHDSRPHCPGKHSEFVAHDVWAYHCGNMLGSVVILADQLALHRRHGGNVTAERSFRGSARVLERIRRVDLNYLARYARFFAEVAGMAPDPEARAVYGGYADVMRARIGLYQPRASRTRRFAYLRAMLADYWANRAGHVIRLPTLVKDVLYAAIGPKAARSRSRSGVRRPEQLASLGEQDEA